MISTAADRAGVIRDHFEDNPPNILCFRHLPKIGKKRHIHHEKMATLFSWLGLDCIDDRGCDEGEPERQPGSVHYFSTYMIFFMKIAEYKIPRNFETEEGWKFKSYTNQMEIIDCRLHRRLVHSTILGSHRAVGRERCHSPE